MKIEMWIRAINAGLIFLAFMTGGWEIGLGTIGMIYASIFFEVLLIQRRSK
jgi:hypothetical protein